MCGRYALALRPSEVRQRLEQSQMPVEEAPEDDSVRHTYNFAPGNHGLVYRADGSEPGGNAEEKESHKTGSDDDDDDDDAASVPAEGHSNSPKYKLQAMKWGLVPFWTKRNPDYGSMIKTINCRDDSLTDNRSMWTSMKKKKRCIVVAQGFYEWLKKNNGKEKLPHFTKRKDDQLMCFAGLWDCVQYEGSDEKLYTYTIITTDSNKQLKFLHNRMPVILDNGSDAIRTWLDPNRTEWSRDLQCLLKPYEGELACYQVSKDVGRVGNNSPSFIVPIDSAANKNNIANFFGNQSKTTRIKKEDAKIEHDACETRNTTNRLEGTEDNAPLPIPALNSPLDDSRGIKRERSEGDDDGSTADTVPQQKRRIPEQPAASQTPEKKPPNSAKRKTRSATSNGSVPKASKGDGSQKITAFFSK